MTIGILPDEVISIENQPECSQPLRCSSSPQKIVEKEINYDEYDVDNSANETRINITQKRWGTSNRCKAITISILLGVITALIINILSIMLFFTFQDFSLAWMSPKSPGSPSKIKPNPQYMTKPSWTDRNGEGLQQVIVLFRYGEISTANETFRNDTNAHYAWDNGYEALTKKGMSRMYKFGQFIRDKYVYLNKGQYTNINTLAMSLDEDYSIASAQTVLAGLYPPNPEDSLAEDFLWRPISVHTIPKDVDEEIGATASCPRLDNLKRSYKNTRYQKLGKNLAETTGISNNETEIRRLFHIYERQKAEGLHIAVNSKYERMREVVRGYFQHITNDNIGRRLTSGPLLNSLLKHMEQKIKEKSTAPNIILYSVNEDVLANLLHSLSVLLIHNSVDWSPPNFGSSIILELYNSDFSKPYVKMSYMDDSLKEEIFLENACHPLPFGRCPLFTLRKNSSDIIPTNWKDECLNV